MLKCQEFLASFIYEQKNSMPNQVKNENVLKTLSLWNFASFRIVMNCIWISTAK